MWDNRQVMHRVRRYDDSKVSMVEVYRSTTIDPPPKIVGGSDAASTKVAVCRAGARMAANSSMPPIG